MGVVADHWMSKYEREFGVYQKASAEVEKQIREALSGSALDIQLVTARAKHPDSVREKIERRKYGRPQQQFDDLIGVRVLTLYDHSVKQAVERIRARFQVDEKRSSDKSARLLLRQVGYRSNHLVIRAQRSGMSDVASVLENTYVEVQVRSVISHAWAEIEHSLRYKVGEGVPIELARRFDALAGTLELVDREFSNIAAETVKLVDDKAREYSAGKSLDDKVSSLQLLGTLQMKRPRARPLGPDGLLLPIEDAFRFAKLLGGCGIGTVDQLIGVLDEWALLDVIRNYVDQSNSLSEPAEASGLVVLGAVIGIKDPDLYLSTRGFTDPLLQECLGLAP